MSENVNIEKPLMLEMIDAVVRERMKEVPTSQCIPQKMYCQLYGISPSNIRNRLSAGQWSMGREVIETNGAGRYIDLEAVDTWARKQGKSCPEA